jgi:protein gp37
MGTKIEWTEETWNPITGCTKCSDGCLNCYAASFAKRLKAMGNARYANGFQVTVHHDLFNKPLQWTKPKMIFVNSMSDIFHDDVPDEDILALFKVMNKASKHTFQVLTKRAERLEKLSPQINWTDNIWMGVSIENQSVLYRADHLKRTGAKVKFISAEPLLESISGISLEGIHWLIVGGESGPKSRTMMEQWVIELRDLAKQHDVPFFFKQWGGINKKKNGSDLQGKQYKEYPR